MAPESSTLERAALVALQGQLANPSITSQCDALFARVMAQFDDIDARIARIRAQMVADGLIRDPGSRTRDGDAK